MGAKKKELALTGVVGLTLCPIFFFLRDPPPPQ